MLVIEDGNRPLVAREDIADRLEKTPPRIENLTTFVRRVAAVLADRENAIHREFVAPQSESAFDGVANRKAVTLGEFAAQIAFGMLIDVHRHDAHLREALAVVKITFEDLTDDDVGVRPTAILGNDGGDALRLWTGHVSKLFY